jgi:hypothetical protein
MVLDSNGFGGFACQPDNPDGTFRIPLPGSIADSVAWSPAAANKNFDGSSVATLRLVSARMRVAYIGSTFEDQGQAFYKMISPDWTEIASGAAQNYGLPGNVNSPTTVDIMLPLKEGADIVFVPLDPASREYAPYPAELLTDGSPATQKVVNGLLSRESDKWPILICFVVGGKPASIPLQFELTCNWEFTARAGSIIARMAPPPGPRNDKAVETESKVSTAVLDGPGPVTSRAETVSAGGLHNFLMERIASPAATGFLRSAGRTAANLLMGARGPGGRAPPALLPGELTSVGGPLIEELEDGVLLLT